jgi:hypothetical protein
LEPAQQLETIAQICALKGFVVRAKDWALARLIAIETLYKQPHADTGLLAEMFAVFLHSQWERYAEERLTEAVINHSTEFLRANGVRKTKSSRKDLALGFVREGRPYFDTRSTKDLIKKGDRLVGTGNNPFGHLPHQLKTYLDTLAAIRNRIVHLSASARTNYKKQLSSSYGLKLPTDPSGFLCAIDRRKNSPARNKTRIVGLMEIVRQAVKATS